MEANEWPHASLCQAINSKVRQIAEGTWIKREIAAGQYTFITGCKIQKRGEKCLWDETCIPWINHQSYNDITEVDKGRRGFSLQGCVVEFQLMGKRTNCKSPLCCFSDKQSRSGAGQHIWAEMKDGARRFATRVGKIRAAVTMEDRTFPKSCDFFSWICLTEESN